MDIARDRRTAIKGGAWTLTLLLLVGGLAGGAGQAQDAVPHINILRENLFERGLGANPKSIALTHDGGLIVAGSMGGDLAWATRIGPAGQVIWRYLLPTANESPGGDESNYAAAVQLPDDSTLLCGTSTVSHKPRGLLTHISPTGALIGQELLDPKGFYIDIRYCARYRDGAAAVGIDSGSGTNKTNVSFRMVIVDGQGKRISDYLLNVPAPGLVLNDIDSEGQDLILVMTGAARDTKGRATVGTRLLRIDSSGSVKTDRTIPGGGFYLHPVAKSSTISLFLEPENENRSRLETLSPSFEDVSAINGSAADLFPTRSFLSIDGSLVFFGRTEVGRNSSSASVTWASPTLHERQVFMFKPLFTNFQVGAAIPSGRPGEFIAVRGVYPRGVPGSEKDPTGLAVTVLKIQ